MTAAIHEFSPAQPRYPEPKPIIGQQVAEPYPIDSLPDMMRNAVTEVQGYVQAPKALVACNAVAIASLATQGLAKVRRDRQLVSPLSLLVWIVAEPSERKSFAEEFFIQPVKSWVREQLAATKTKWDQYIADMDVWEASRKGIKLHIQKLAKDGDRAGLEKASENLRSLIEERPKRPLVPKLHYSDATIQAITDGLQKYPTGGILTSEGGAFFGGAGMYSDSIMGAMAVYNDLWTGSEIAIDRKGEGSVMLRDVALMMSISVQPEVLRKFISKTGTLARGSGFLARPLLAMPESTQGQRLYKSPPADFPALALLNDRIKELLSLQPAHVGEDGRLSRVTLELSEPAKAVWVRYYDASEKDQQIGGGCEFVRPEAGRSADNASRLAGIFHILEHGLEGEISRDNMVRACTIAQWHLGEAKRFLFASEMPEQFSNAEAISKRIAAYIRKRKEANMPDWNIITRRDILRECKVAGVQKNETLNPIINELLEADHLLNRENEKRGKQVITVNPRLLEVIP